MRGRTFQIQALGKTSALILNTEAWVYSNFFLWAPAIFQLILQSTRLHLLLIYLLLYNKLCLRYCYGVSWVTIFGNNLWGKVYGYFLTIPQMICCGFFFYYTYLLFWEIIEVPQFEWAFISFYVSLSESLHSRAWFIMFASICFQMKS